MGENYFWPKLLLTKIADQNYFWQKLLLTKIADQNYLWQKLIPVGMLLLRIFGGGGWGGVQGC